MLLRCPTCRYTVLGTRDFLALAKINAKKLKIECKICETWFLVINCNARQEREALHRKKKREESVATKDAKSIYMNLRDTDMEQHPAKMRDKNAEHISNFIKQKKGTSWNLEKKENQTYTELNYRGYTLKENSPITANEAKQLWSKLGLTRDETILILSSLDVVSPQSYQDLDRCKRSVLERHGVGQ